MSTACHKIFLKMFLILLAIMVAPTSHANLCEELKGLNSNAKLNFSNTISSPMPTHISNADECKMVLTLNESNTYHCSWKFGYRDALAQTTFDKFDEEVLNCFQQSKRTVDRQTVNHPDSYQQHLYKTGDVVISVSIKDKGELQETYVFINVKGIKKSK